VGTESPVATSSISPAIESNNLAIDRGWEAGSIGELKCIEQAIGAEVDRDDGGEAGARSREAKFLKFIVAAEVHKERPMDSTRCRE
jgi:hypothetical protein